MGASSGDVSTAWPPLQSVLISGATGWLGTCLAKEFLESVHGYTVVLLARREAVQTTAKQAMLSILDNHGAKIVLLPDASYNLEGLTSVMKGIDLVISAVGHQQDALESQYLLLRAAKRARVKRFIPSNFGLDLNRIPHGIMQMYDAKRKFQDAVVNSGLEYTIVCCGCFYETFFTPFFSFDPFRRKVVIKGSMDDRFWATSARDVARWLPDIVQSPVSRNAKVNLVGQNVSWREAVAAFEQAAGAPFQVVQQPTHELKVRVSRQADCWATFPDRIALCVSQGWFLPDGQQAWNIKQGRSTLSVRDHAQDVMSRRLPKLARAALSGAETPVTPTGQQSARGANAIMVEWVLSDGFPMPVCLPLPEEQQP